MVSQNSHQRLYFIPPQPLIVKLSYEPIHTSSADPVWIWSKRDVRRVPAGIPSHISWETPGYYILGFRVIMVTIGFLMLSCDSPIISCWSEHKYDRIVAVGGRDFETWPLTVQKNEISSISAWQVDKYPTGSVIDKRHSDDSVTPVVIHHRCTEKFKQAENQ